MKTKNTNSHYINDDIMLQFNSLMSKAVLMDKKIVFRLEDDTYTSTEIHLLDTIGRFPDANVTELARHQSVTKGAISQKLSRFEKNGLIQRYKDPDNSKEVLVALTEKGWLVFHAHMKFHHDFNTDIFDSINNLKPEELTLLMNILKILNQNIDAHFMEDNVNVYNIMDYQIKK